MIMTSILSALSRDHQIQRDAAPEGAHRIRTPGRRVPAADMPGTTTAPGRSAAALGRQDMSPIICGEMEDLL
jgi:hypothetical protein